MEATYIPEQEVQAGQSAILNTSIPCPKGYVIHYNGSGIIKLRGIVNNACCPFARYLCTFNSNIAIPTGGTVAPISVALAIDGEALPQSIAISSPATAGVFNHVGGSAIITVPRGCCFNLTLKNVSADNTTISMTNTKVDVTRIA